MRYFKARINSTEEQTFYGDVPTSFVLGYEDKETEIAYFALPKELELNFLEIEEINEMEYEISINTIKNNNKNARLNQDRELLKQLKDQLDLNNMLRNQLKTADQKYKELDLTTADLQTVKDAKMAQLDELCNITIENGFDYNINGVSYHFSASLSAQANFQGADTLFKDGSISEAEWTVKNNETGKVERILIDQTNFNSLKLKVFQHINTNISRLRNELQVQVESETTDTNVKVDAIVW